MSLFFPRRTRAAAAPPSSEARGIDMLPFGPFGAVSSYENVQITGMESAFQSIAARSAMDLIASLVSELPLEVYSGRLAERQLRPTPGYLLDPAGDGHGTPDWLYQVLESWMMRGNLWGQILATGPGGIVTQLLPLYPDHCAMSADGDGTLMLRFKGAELPAGSWLHRRANPITGCVQGLSVIGTHMHDLGLDVTLTRFGLDYFQQGAQPNAVLTNEDRAVNDEVMARRMKQRFMDSLRGREPVLLGKGWKYQAININPEESQFLESRAFTAADICKIFGPGVAELFGYGHHGSSLTYANVVDRSVELLKFTIDKWIKRAERLLTDMLPRPQYAVLDRDALLATATLQRYQANALAITTGFKTRNEVRTEENLPSLPGGDELQLTPGPAAAGDGQPSTGGSNA